MQTRELDWLSDIEGLRNHLSTQAVELEAEALRLLPFVERARKQGSVDEAQLDRAEAVLLTILAEARWHKQGKNEQVRRKNGQRQIEEGRKLAKDGRMQTKDGRQQTEDGRKRKTGADGMALVKEWTHRARQLDPSYPQAAELYGELNLHMLVRSRRAQQAFPTIRETDNAANRKKQVEALISIAEGRLAEGERFLDLIAAGEEASLAADTAREQSYHHLRQLTVQAVELLQEVIGRARAYSDSLQGIFYSSELMDRLQTALESVAETENKITELLTAQMEDESFADWDHIEPPPSALDAIEELIGLHDIKERIRQLSHYLTYQQIRSEKGWMLQDQPSLHLVLMGNPGTGKTTLARLIARLYHELGLLERDEVVEVDRSHLVGAYVGQTEQRTMEVIRRAAGGVLFIDEAYSLKRADSSGSDYGQVAVDTLVAAMTGGEYAGTFVVILAGYPEEMRHFLQANPGLRSRFPESGQYELPDFTDDELLQIAVKVAAYNDYTITPDALYAIRQRVGQERVDETFGNARAVKQIVMEAIFAKGRRVEAGEGQLTIGDFTVIEAEDVMQGGRRGEATGDQLSATAKLEQMIGLSNLKAEMKKIAAFLTIQCRRQEQGLPSVPVELHAVFTGHPGTGKTTVAKLYAGILRETGYLKRGHLVTASRADLVADYVGQTASKTKRKIREALGGVLFIDEAYSLTQSMGGQDYGKEAVTTLVDEISRHGENLVVVLAGYPYEMEQFILSNPGLASRFKKYVDFPDYTVEELLAIMQKAVADAGYRMDSGVEERLAEELHRWQEARGLQGNGRLAYNLVHEAIQEQALRLSELPMEQLDGDRLSELVWDDFKRLFEK